MAISNKQKAAIAAIVLVGAVATAALLVSGRHVPEGEDANEHAEHTESGGHEDAEHHGKEAEHKDADAKGHADHEHHATTKKGAHGGDVTSVGDISVEVALSEEGGEPRLRLWASKGSSALEPQQLKAAGTLTRPTGETEELVFEPSKEFLATRGSVEEPHFFDAEIRVTVPGTDNPVVAKLSKDEGKVKLSSEQQKTSNIATQVAGPAKLLGAHQFQGEIRFNEDRTAHVVPRLAGVVDSVPAQLGQTVAKGQVLAVISSATLSEQRSELLAAQQRRAAAKVTYEREKKLWEDKISAQQDYLAAQTALREADIAVQNATQKLAAIGAGAATQGLNRFELRAPFNGTIVEKHIALGEAVKEDASIFTISDLSSVWAEFVVSPKDLASVRVGQKAVVTSTAFDGKAEGDVSYVGSLLGEQTRTAKARVTLANPNLAWRPGLFVTVTLTGSDAAVSVAVPADAVQTLNNESVVFLAVPGGFVAQPVKVGRTDGKMVEILDGLKPGAKFAATNTFVIKSELGKSSATHTH